MKHILILSVYFLSIASKSVAEPLFYSSVNSNYIDYIREEDPSTFLCIKNAGVQPREMIGKPYFSASLNAHVFDMHFSDGTKIPIWVHPDVGDAQKVADEVAYFSGPLGKLPTTMRRNLDHVVLNAGDETPFSEDAGRFIILATETMRKRRAENDMEETIFHETVHATLDIPFSKSAAWKAAQKADDDFITGYAAEYPNREDFAETALMAYTYYHHPERLGWVKEKMEALIPNRLNYLISTFYPNDDPNFYKVAEAESCE